MWTDSTRPKYERKSDRYATDLTDEEFDLIAPHLPPSKRRGRPRTTSIREVVNALCYLLRTGCQWRMLPKDFPPKSTVYEYFGQWRDNGTLENIHHTLYQQTRELEGREASPTAGVIDSQSVKTTESGGPRGYDAGKKINGRKRHIVTDTIGLLLDAEVHSADIQDRDGAPLVLRKIDKLFSWVETIFADSAYAGDKLAEVLSKIGPWKIQVVKRPDDAKGFVVIPKRWVVERTFAWINRNRRLAKDFEKRVDNARAYIFLAMIGLMVRRLARA